MTSDICGQLMNKFDNLNRLHGAPYARAIIEAHVKFCRAAKASADTDRPRPALRRLEIAEKSFFFDSLLGF